jgi:hypothetical protein
MNKKESDELAARYFKTQGYEACAVEKPGRRVDVIACNVNRGKFAVIEVKGDEERDATQSQCLKERDYNLCGLPRKEVWNKLSPLPTSFRTEEGIARLVAFVISNQLYCYFWDVLKKPSLYRDVIPEQCRDCEPSSFEDVEAYLVMPVACLPVVEWVSTQFYNNSWLPRPCIIKTTDKICVTQVFYPETPPIDLAASA